MDLRIATLVDAGLEQVTTADNRGLRTDRRRIALVFLCQAGNPGQHRQSTQHLARGRLALELAHLGAFLEGGQAPLPVRRLPSIDRKGVVSGKNESVRVDPGGRRTIKKKKN